MNFWDRNNNIQSNADGQNKNDGVNKNMYNKTNNENDNNFEYKNMGQSDSSQSIDDEINRYSTMSSDDLMSELASKVCMAKSNGSFDIGELEKFYSVATMFMNADQLKRLRAILNAIEK